MTLLEAVQLFCNEHGLNKTYYVAYSGGLDSQVLLHLLHQVRLNTPIKLHAIHINHGLSPNAKDWAAHCTQFCIEHDIDLIVHELALKTKSNIEETARIARYAIFKKCVQANDLLLTAHQQNDQAETLLLQLCRGAGPKGLASMPIIKPFGNGWQARPLLAFSRAELQAYAKAHQLKWIEDESNDNQHYTRNFLRLSIMPPLTLRWPNAQQMLTRSAELCAESQTLLEEFALELYPNVKGTQADTLSIRKLLNLSPERQRLLLRIWLQQLGFSIPDKNKLMAIQTTVLTAAADRFPLVTWRNVEIRRYQDDLYALPSLSSHDTAQWYAWNVAQPLLISGLGTLSMQPQLGAGLNSKINHVTIRFRAGGEQVEISKRGRLSLKNLWQEWQVPYWERSRIPLVYGDQKLIAIPGYFLHVDYAAQKNEIGRVLGWAKLSVVPA